MASCSHSGCFRLDGKHVCRYAKLGNPSIYFMTPVEEELSDRLGLVSPVSVSIPEGDLALELIQEAALTFTELSLDVELQGYRPEDSMESRHEVLAPVPPLMECRPTHGALHRSSGRRSLIHLRKLVSPVRPSLDALPQTLRDFKGKPKSKVSYSARKGAATCGVIGKSKFSGTNPRLRMLVFRSISASLPRHPLREVQGESSSTQFRTE